VLSDSYSKSATINVTDLFDDNKRVSAIGRLQESNVVELCGRERFIVNMRQVNLIKEENAELVFYFSNGDFLVVQDTGRIKYVRR